MRSNVERDADPWQDSGAQAPTWAAAKQPPRGFHVLCFLGLHTPGEDEVWHAGYGFAHCRRCGDEIVTSLLSDWQRPGTRLKVVWPTGSTGEAQRPRSTRAAKAVGLAMKPISDAAPRWSEPKPRAEIAAQVRAEDRVGNRGGEDKAEDKAAPLELSPVHEVERPGAVATSVAPAPAIAAPPAPAKMVSLLPDDFMGAVPSPLPAIAPATVRLPDFDDLMGGDAEAQRALAAQKAS